jgi:23S rRNA pseudouridine1911/1915/1917 synthase
VTRIEEVIPAALAGERVDRVTAMITGLSRSAVARLVEDGSLTLDSARVDIASTRVEEGQLITVEMPEPRDVRPQPDPDIHVPVVFADDDIIVVDKPAGMVVHPGAGRRSLTMVHGLLARFPEIADVGDPDRPGIVHRLDRGTSGLLVVARSAVAYERLVDQLSRREAKRVYTTLVWGNPGSDEGTIDAPIGRSARHPTRMTVSEGGREAVTHYVVEHRYVEPSSCALLTIRLETGRTHQIRVHLRAIGHPVVGDRDYDGVRPGIALDRPFLHAATLGFSHPTHDEPMSFDSPLPPELAVVLADLAG